MCGRRPRLAFHGGVHKNIANILVSSIGKYQKRLKKVLLFVRYNLVTKNNFRLHLWFVIVSLVFFYLSKW